MGKMLICVDCTSEPTSRQVRSGQTVGRMLSGDYVERMLMSVDKALKQLAKCGENVNWQT